MRTTFNLKDDLYRRVSEITGIREKTKLIHIALENLLQKEAANRLAGMRGIFKGAKAAPRRKSKQKDA